MTGEWSGQVVLVVSVFQLSFEFFEAAVLLAHTTRLMSGQRIMQQLSCSSNMLYRYKYRYRYLGTRYEYVRFLLLVLLVPYPYKESKESF